MGGNKYGSEEYHIGKTLRWLQEKPPAAVVHVDKITTIGCNFLPSIAYNAISRAPIRIQLLTHADTLSKTAIRHQLALAEELNAKIDHQKQQATAIFVINPTLVLKQRQLRPLIDGLYGAYILGSGKIPALVVTGPPNVGKSSIIFPLTKPRTLQVKKKKAYHLPRISSTAGHTLGVKSHVMSAAGYSNDLTLYDTPGLRRRIEDAEPRTIIGMVGSNVTEFRNGYSEFVTPMDCVDFVLKALNRHAALTGMEVPTYGIELGLDRYTNDPNEILTAYRNHESTKGRSEMEFIRRCNRGEFGGLVFSDRQPRSVERINLEDIREQDSIITYMNEAAQQLISYATNPGTSPDFELEVPRPPRRGHYHDDDEDELQMMMDKLS